MKEDSSTAATLKDWAEVFDAQKSIIERLTPPQAVLKAAERLNGYVGYYHGCHKDINTIAGWLLALPSSLTAQADGPKEVEEQDFVGHPTKEP